MPDDEKRLPAGGSGPRLHHALTRQLLADIAKGKYAAANRLPSEMVLAGDLQVSRGVVRELLLSLESKSVIEMRVGRGARVRPISEWNILDLDILVALLATPASVTVLAQYLECRRILEVEAAALAAERASGNDLQRMADALAQMAEFAPGSSTNAAEDHHFHQADIAFHGAIYHASGNQVLPRVVEPIQHAMAELRPKLALHPEHRMRRTMPEHKEILAAIADRDAGRARVAMATHLGTVETYLQEYRRQQTGIAIADRAPDAAVPVAPRFRA